MNTAKTERKSKDSGQRSSRTPSPSGTKRRVRPSKMFCWGSTTNGELGLGGIEEELILAPRELKFKDAFDIVQVASGDFHTLVVTNSGKVFSCGSNDHNQLGHTKSCKKLELVDSLETYTITRVVCGVDFSMALDEWGRVLCWGSDSHGQLGLGTGGGSAAPQMKPKIVKGLATTTTSKAVQIACGQRHCLVLTDNGELYSWGANSYGQLGLGTMTGYENTPSLVRSLAGLPIGFIQCGGNHSFLVSKSGAVYGWGKNTFGQLGLSDNIDKAFPNQLRGLRSTKVTYIACGEDFTVFLTKDGGVFTCGAGMYGQLGHGAISNEYLPRKVLELMGSTVTQVACGRRHTLAFVPSRGRVYAFGLGGAGQLGTRATLNSSTPQVVLGSWVSPSGVPVVQTNDLETEDSTLSYTVKRVFAGGDHCFATVTYYLDMVSPSDLRVHPASSQILTLTHSKMEAFEAVLADAAVDLELLEYVEIVFNSQACINASFLLPNDEHFWCSSKNLGIDLPKAEESFTCIGRVENETLKHLIWSFLITTLSSLSWSPPDIETLRIYILYPLYYEFENPKNWEALQNCYGMTLLKLKAEAAKIIGLWWSILPSDYFERMVRIFKNVVLYLLTQAAQSTVEIDGCSPNMIIPLELLGKLSKVNNSMDGQKVPYDSFYIPELTEKLDVRIDYMKWVLNRDPHMANKVYFCNYPFIFDANAKTMLLQTDQSMQMQSAVNMATSRALTSLIFSPVQVATISPHLELNVTRENIVSDTIRELVSVLAHELKKPLKVTFLGEEAEDAGGVRKEFFMLLLREILDPKYGMFIQYDETRTVWFSEDSLEESIMYYLIGIVCGLAIYNFTIINLPFPLALYKKLLKEPVTLQDLKGLSPTLAKSLQDVLDYKEPDLEDIFSLDFEVTRETFGEVKSVPLKPGGGDIPVTQENKVEFVDLYVDLILNKAVEKQYEAFAEGFHRVCGSKVMELFHSHELMAVVVGNENYDWEELESNTEYRNGYTASDMTIRFFWEVFHELTEEEKRKFLLFLTGCDRIPILGMKTIKIYIQPTTDDKFLPVAHTCFNLLDLPRYSTKEKLRYKLLQAIQQTHVFSLV